MIDILYGIVGSLIASIIWLFALRFYLGSSASPGLRAALRLKRDLRLAGIINFFPNRSYYHVHKEHGSAANYIISSTHSNLLYIGFWLAGSTELGSLVKAIEELAIKRISVCLVFVDPKCKEVMSHCSNYFGISQGEFKGRVLNSIKKIQDAQNALLPQYRQYISIKLHNVPITTSAFLIDYDNSRNCKILLDHKLFGMSRDNSYGIEFKNSDKVVCKNALISYMQINDNAKPCDIL